MLKKPLFLIVLAGLSFAALSFVEDFHDEVVAEEQNRVLNIGDPAPELTFKDPDGNTRSLSDLRGKIVLIDFWASWCRPCRMENPNVVRVYNQYKDAKFKKADGFEVFSVSLDRNKADWQKAIQADNLKWENHVSDLKFWQSAGAKAYNVNSIPATFLIDEEGIIIAKNLRGRSLENTLSKLAD